MHTLGGVEEVRRRPGRRECRCDLAADQPRLAHPGDDHSPAAAAQELDRALEALVEPGDEPEDRLGLDAQHPLGQAPEVRFLLCAHE